MGPGPLLLQSNDTQRQAEPSVFTQDLSRRLPEMPSVPVPRQMWQEAWAQDPRETESSSSGQGLTWCLEGRVGTEQAGLQDTLPCQETSGWEGAGPAFLTMTPGQLLTPAPGCPPSAGPAISQVPFLLLPILGILQEERDLNMPSLPCL